QNRKRDTEIQNRLLNSGGEREGLVHWEDPEESGGEGGGRGDRDGEYIEELQDALGVTEKSLPPFIYRMCQLGYPPGWLKEAELENSGLELYDGKDGADGETEAGEVQQTISVTYDLSRLVNYPGFNISTPRGIPDEWRIFGSIPMQACQQKDVFANYLTSNFQAPSMKSSSKRSSSQSSPSSPKKQEKENSAAASWNWTRMGPPTGFLRQTFPPSPRGPGSGLAPLMGGALRHTVENTPLWELIPKRRKRRTESSFLSYSSQVYKFTKSRLLPGKRDHEESPSFQKAKGREQRPCSLYSPGLLFSESSGFTAKPVVKQDCDGPEGCDQGEMSRSYWHQRSSPLPLQMFFSGGLRPLSNDDV
ncbi:hypothetical protein FD755_024991, partial [Muntiacus reevesi]